MGRATIGLAVLLAAGLGISTARADAVCEKGYRDTTPAERQTVVGVKEAIRAALPLAPTGWVIGGYEEISAIDKLCMDGESTPWVYGFSRSFARADDQEAREQALAEVRTAARAAQAARQPKIDEIMAKMQALGEQLGAAAQNGDEARIDSLNAEIEKLRVEFDDVMSQSDDSALVEATARATMQDRSMSIAVSVNPGSAGQGELQPAAAPAGAQSAHRWTTSDSGVDTAHVLVLFGAWQPREGGGFDARQRAGASSAAAHAVAVAVEADPGRLDSLLGSIDFAAIAALLR